MWSSQEAGLVMRSDEEARKCARSRAIIEGGTGTGTAVTMVTTYNQE